MSGKPQVSATRLANMLDVLANRPSFKGRVYLQPDGGIEIDTTTDGGRDAVDSNEAASDLTEEELAAFGSAA